MSDLFYLHLHKFFAGGVTAAVGIVYLLVGGCPTTESTNALTGTVMSGGRPVTFGTVTVIAADQKVYQAPIRPDGRYELKGLPPGPVRVAVNSPNPRPQWGPGPAPAKPASGTQPANGPAATGGMNKAGPTGNGGSGDAKQGKRQTIAATAQVPAPVPAGPADNPAAQTWFPIPGKYGSPQSSGITGTAGPGTNPFDIRVD